MSGTVDGWILYQFHTADKEHCFTHCKKTGTQNPTDVNKRMLIKYRHVVQAKYFHNVHKNVIVNGLFHFLSVPPYGRHWNSRQKGPGIPWNKFTKFNVFHRHFHDKTISVPVLSVGWAGFPEKYNIVYAIHRFFNENRQYYGCHPYVFPWIFILTMGVIHG